MDGLTAQIDTDELNDRALQLLRTVVEPVEAVFQRLVRSTLMSSDGPLGLIRMWGGDSRVALAAHEVPLLKIK
jgi:hypothetical protein